jgi:hypothetical protein
MPKRERPIIFGAESVRAIMEGRKTQTRRVIKLPPTSPTSLDLSDPNEPWRVVDGAIFIETGWRSCWVVECPYGSPRARLWVREAWREQAADQISYRADGEVEGARWRSPILMPRWASRITLEIAAVRVERLQEISDEDVAAEGGDSRNAFAVYWDALNAKRGHPWASDPWVWVLEFRRLNGAAGH